MSDTTTKWVSAAIVAVAIAGLSAAAHADPASKWRIQFGDGAYNDGTITFRVAPEGGSPVDVETKVTKGSGASNTARTVRDSLKASLGDGYKVETDDGQDVIVRANGKTPKFDLALAGSTLSGLSVRFKKE